MDNKDNIISNVKCCLLSTKGKITLKQLEKDYRILIGSPIPYTKLGFKKLEDLLRSDPCFSIQYSNGEIFVDAVSEKAAHISEMVNRQKTDKKASVRAKRNKKVTFVDTRQRSVQPERWRPKLLDKNQNKIVQTSGRPAAVRHNQFINTTPQRTSTLPPLMSLTTSVPSKVIIPETSSLFNGNKKSAEKTTMTIKKSDISQRLVLDNSNIKVRNDSTIEPCSSLISTKKRITKKMTEMNLNRDSGHSSPTSELSPIYTSSDFISNNQEFTRTHDPIADIQNFIRIYKLGDFEVSINKVAKEGFYTCHLKAGKKTFNSYPKEFRDQISAQRYCSELALEELIPQYTQKKVLLYSSEKDILERIPPMLEKHSNCLWVWQLEMDYTDRYGEKLPADWLKIIDSSPCIQVEKLLDNCVIKYCKPGEKGLKCNTRINISDVSIPSNTVQFGDDNRLTAEVVYVVSANEIWCRQLETNERKLYDALVEKMDLFYNENYTKLEVTSVTEGGYYIAYYEDAWYRVRAVSVEGDDVNCFFIDFGDETITNIKNLYKLQREFATSQAQAFVCRLIGLEDLYEASVGSETLQRIIYDKVLTVELAQDTSANGTNDLSIPVYMYNLETGKSINNELIPLLSMESASPHLSKDSISDVVISNIEDNGDIYVQIHSHGYHSLCEQMLSLEKQINEKPPRELLTKITKQNSNNKTYLAKYKVDNHWRRVNIIDWSPNEDMAQIYFVDYGNTDVVIINKDELYPLEKLSDILNQYPYQAVKVRMEGIIPNNFKEICLNEMPVNSSVLLKIAKNGNDDVPLVEFFKRNADGGLFCVNKSIELKQAMKGEKKETENMQNIKRKLMLNFDGLNKNVPSAGVLQRPSLPNKKDMFEVHIPFSVNPWNFFIQPLKSQRELHKLMLKLQQTYSVRDYSPLHKDDIIPGKIYASKHEDGYWYRTSVIKVIHAGSISVFYCDYGYYGNLTVQQLIPLEPEFMELPYQALKAKLADVKPTRDKWTVEDCEKFKKLVEGKHFVSILADLEKDELYESDIVLKLYLVDTSTDSDIYIGKELIKEGIAVKV